MDSLRPVAAGAVLVLATITGLHLAGDGDGRRVAEYETYVAIGDSYTAAPGVPVNEGVSGCGRSSGNYPALVAAELGAAHVDVSCGAAATKNLVEPQPVGSGTVPPQLDALSERTDLVTVRIGVNDQDLFIELLNTCLEVRDQRPDGTPCRDALTTGGVDRMTSKIATMQTNLQATVAEIRERAPAARLLLVGYPQLVPADGYCELLPIARGDYEYVRDVWSALDRALQAAASETDLEFVDVLEASEGHDICAGDEAWVNGVVTDPARAEALHPFPEEQQAVAELILDVL